MRKKKYSATTFRKAEKSALENKLLSFRPWKRTHQTEKSKKRAEQFQPKRQKKNHRYLVIKRTHVDTLYSLKNSFTNNVLYYPIRCCAIRSLERRFQEKRQSSVSGGVVLVVLVYLVYLSLLNARAVKEKSRWMMCLFSTLDDDDDDDEKCDRLLRVCSLALSRK